MKFQALHDFIKRHDTITIFAHIYPDGDAIGSIIGLRELIKTNYPSKQVFGIGANVAPFVQIVGPTDEVSEDIIQKSGALIIDVANKDRVDDQRFLLALESFKVDHHLFVETFTNEEIVCTNRIATAEIIGEYMLAFNLAINEVGATALLLGIMTDSGRFMYDLTSSLTFEVAALLMKNGADLQRINNYLSQRKLETIKPRGYFLHNFETYQNIIFIKVNYETLLSLNIAPSSGGMFVNTYANIIDYPLWATFFEDKDGVVFVELRSKSYNVQKIARLFDGGGHLKASGCRIASLAEVNIVLDALRQAEEI